MNKRYSGLTPGEIAVYGFFGVIIAVLAVIGLIGLEAWLLMLFLGVLHIHLWAAVPALSFLQSFLAVVAANFVRGWLKRMFQPNQAVTK